LRMPFAPRHAKLRKFPLFSSTLFWTSFHSNWFIEDCVALLQCFSCKVSSTTVDFSNLF
jgi:hypothetical protein